MTPWYGSIQLIEARRTIPIIPGFDIFERSYTSAVGWPRGRFGCTQVINIIIRMVTTYLNRNLFQVLFRYTSTNREPDDFVGYTNLLLEIDGSV